jgi:hypothetical protein
MPEVGTIIENPDGTQREVVAVEQHASGAVAVVTVSVGEPGEPIT